MAQIPQKRLSDLVRAWLLVLGKGICYLLVVSAVVGFDLGLSVVRADVPSKEMTKERALELSERFGVDVGEVDAEIQQFLGLTRAEGVVVFAVLGGSPADLAGVKAKSVIKEVDGIEIKTLLDLGRALESALPTENFSVATYEPADIADQGVGGGLNFHFVRVKKD